MSIEKIVRPFQTGDVFTARVVMPVLPPSGSQASDDVCVLTWSGKNPGQYDDVPSDLQLIGFHVDWNEDKAQRIVEEVKIEQEDNPDNFVIVQRMKSTVLQNDKTGQTFNLKFADWDKGRK